MKIFTSVVLMLMVLGTGCNRSDVANTDSKPSPAANQLVMSAEPSNAVSVGKARELVETEQEVTLVGRIGGSSQPFIEGMSVFTIVDLSVAHCSDQEGCPTPWDYCCTQDQVKNNIATIKLVDDSDQPLEIDARQIPGIKELATIVMQGNAKRDDQGNLIVSAKNLFVRSSK